MVLRALMIAMLLVTGCDDSKSKKKSSGAANEDEKSGTVENGETLPGFGKLAGTLQMAAGDKNMPAANAKIEIASRPEYATVADENGKFEIDNMPPGTLTVYATAESSTSLTEGGKLKTAQIKNIVVGAGEETLIPEDTILKDPGTITGSIALINNPKNVDLVGIDIYVPGTSFIAKSDKDGKFTISNVPAGSYDVLRFDKSGLTSSEMNEVLVESGKNTDLGTIYMSLSTGPSGKIVSIKDQEEVEVGGVSSLLLEGNTVSVNLLSDSRATLMKVAHESAFINVDWIPVANSYSFNQEKNPGAVLDYATDGSKSVFVKFADQNGLESSVYQLQFVIDNDAPTLDSINILNGWAQSATQSVFIDVEGEDKGSGIKEIMLSNSSDFSGASWQSYNGSRVDWTLANASGANSVYVKIRDYKNRESSVSTDGINVDVYTLIHNSTYTNKYYLYKAQSPYRISEDVTFDGDLEIEAGTTFALDNGRKLTVKGVFISKGTASEKITIKYKDAAANTCGMMGGGSGSIDLESGEPGVSKDNWVEHTNFVFLDMIYVNGGTFKNNHFDSSFCTNYSNGTIEKTGLDNLLIDGNLFTEWEVAVNVKEGDGNTVFSNNTGTMSGGVHQSNIAANTTVKDNDFSLIESDYTYGALGFRNDKDMEYSGNTISGSGIPLLVDNRSEDLVISSFDVTGCENFIKANLQAGATVTVNNSTISGCGTFANLNNFSLGSNGTFRFDNLDITVSRTLIEAGFQTPAIQFNNSLISIDCGTTNGTHCDLLYLGNANKINSGDGMCANERSHMNVNLTGNNIYCYGNATSGCRGLTLQMPPKDGVEQGTTGTTPCDFDTNYTTLDFDGNYWSGDSGSKTLPNATNLNTASTSIINYSQVANDTMTINATQFQRYEVNYPNADIIGYSGPGFPTVTTTTENPTAGPQ